MAGATCSLTVKCFDGTDVGPLIFPSDATIAVVKAALLSALPATKTVRPVSASQFKLIYSGRLLDDDLRLSDFLFAKAGDATIDATLHATWAAPRQLPAAAPQSGKAAPVPRPTDPAGACCAIC